MVGFQLTLEEMKDILSEVYECNKTFKSIPKSIKPKTLIKRLQEFVFIRHCYSGNIAEVAGKDLKSEQERAEFNYNYLFSKL